MNATDSRILGTLCICHILYARTKECHHPLRHIMCDEWKKHTIRIDYLNWFPHFHFSIMDCVFVFLCMPRLRLFCKEQKLQSVCRSVGNVVLGIVCFFCVGFWDFEMNIFRWIFEQVDRIVFLFVSFFILQFNRLLSEIVGS